MIDLSKWTQDDVMDAASEIIDTQGATFEERLADAKRRESAMNRAHAAGLQSCEICGRVIRSEGHTVAGFEIGPTCYKKLLRLGW